MIAEFFFSFGNHLHENPRLPTTPFYFLSLFYVLSLVFLPRFAFAQNREWAGPSLVWHHWVFPMRLPQSCSDVRQISLQWACPHCLYSVIDAGMLEVTHESKSAFHALLLTPHWSHSLCVRLGVKSSSVWSCACTACSAVPLHLLIECCFEMLTLYKRKRKCKKKKEKTIQNTHRQTHKICICIYTCPYKYT